jgi:threonine synthase
VGLERLVLKREDLNPTGSHKARGVAFQVSVERARLGPGGWLCTSSSGNAAVAAAAYSAAAGLRLAAFLAPDTAAEKRDEVARLGGYVFLTPHALTMADEFSAARRVSNLRPSVHPDGATGFQTIGWELLETVAPVDAVFMFASSAGGLVGIGRAFQRGAEVVDQPWQPALHVVQGCGAHPIAGPFDARPAPAADGRVGALGARKTRRLGEATRLIRASGGGGWIVSDDEAYGAARLLADHGITTSLEGTAALAAASRAAREIGLTSAVVVLTGRRRGPVDDPPVSHGSSGGVWSVVELAEVLAVVDADSTSESSDA